MIRNLISWFWEEVGLLYILLVLIPIHYMFGFLGYKLPNQTVIIVYSFMFLLSLAKGHLYPNRLWLSLLVYLPFTILFASPNPVFRSWERLTFFSLLFLSFGPAFYSNYNCKYKEKALKATLIIFSFLSIGSFFGYFLGINYFSMDEETSYLDNIGWFSGLTYQSMTLGPISGISAIWFFFLAYVKKKRVFWFFCISCIGAMLFAASRAAFGATILGLIVVVYITANKSSKTIKRLLLIGMIISATSSLWSGATSALLNKHDGQIINSSLLDTRSDKYEARFSEFCSSPLFGVGFSAIDINGKDGYNNKTGTIEPGSSWLAILSMTGLMGSLLFGRGMYKTLKFMKKDENYSWLFGILCFFCVHMFAEGYIFAAGNPLTFSLWLVIGCCCDRVFIETNIKKK